MPPAKPAAKQARNFYASALAEAERVKLPSARRVEALGDEIALLRLQIEQQLREHPEDVELVLKSMDTLAKLVAHNYRLSPKSKDDLLDNLLGVIDGISKTIWPEHFGGAG